VETGKLIRLGPSAMAKEKRLAGLAEGRSPADLAHAERAVDDARLAGSLELANSTTAAEAERLRAAWGVRPEAAFAVDALLDWHAAVTGSAEGLRSSARDRRDGPPACPPGLIRGRLENLEHWLATAGAAQLSASQRGALVLARLTEILPFHDANGRVARLATSHVMARAGVRPPILVGADRQRIEACLQAAFQLSTEPLVMLLDEGMERALDAAIRALEG
jgi:Fic family protein